MLGLLICHDELTSEGSVGTKQVFEMLSVSIIREIEADAMELSGYGETDGFSPDIR